jgi:anti-sigma factor ChrR (cupin superfamily)
MSIESLATLLETHQANHLRQIENIKLTLGLSASSEPWLDGVVSASAANAPVRSPGDGVRVRTIWQNGVRRALQVEIDAGKQWPGLDYHVPGPEEVYIVSGDYDDGQGVYGTGTFLHHPAGSSHSPRSKNGCVLLVYYPEG